MMNSSLYTNEVRYLYTTMGKIIESDIEIPELELCLNPIKADILIKLGKVPECIENPVETCESYSLSKLEFLFHKPNLASFFISRGSLIIIEIDVIADMKTVRTYLLGTALGMAFYQSNSVIFHGSTIAFNDSAAIITGDCGAGKSTLCASLRLRDMKYLSDDMSAISFNSELGYMIEPGYAQQRFELDTLKLLNMNMLDVEKACQDDDKWLLKSDQDFQNYSAPFKALFVLKKHQEVDLSIIEIKGIQKIKPIVENMYCFLLTNRAGISIEILNEIERVANQVRVFEINRPYNTSTIEQISDFVEGVIKGKSR